MTRSLEAAGLVLLLAAAAGPAAGQTAAVQGAAADAAAFEAPAAGADPIQDIVVTTQHRSQSLQEVPLSVTAITGDVLESEHLENFADLARLTPGFVAGENYGFIRNASMRGISNNQFGFADDPSIAQYVDGIYQGRGGTGSQVNALYDVERVEVIKGPQATLFGRSSIAGAISTIVNQPTTDGVRADAELGAGEHDRLVARAAVNVPLSEDFAVRVAADSESESGYIRNLAGGPDLQPLDVKAARAIARYTGVPGLDVSAKFDIEERRQSGSIYQDAGLPDFVVADSSIGGANRSVFNIWDADLRAKYDLTDALSVTSTTSYRRVANAYSEKYDASADIIAGPYTQGSNDALFQQDVIFNYAQGPFSATAGGTYFNESLNAFVSNLVDSGFAFTGAPSPGLLPGDSSLAFTESGVFSGSFHGYSVFGDGTVEMLPGLKATAGVRYNYDKKSFTQDVYDPSTLPINAGKPFAGAYYNWGYYPDLFTGVRFPSASERRTRSLVAGFVAFQVGVLRRWEFAGSGYFWGLAPCVRGRLAEGDARFRRTARLLDRPRRRRCGPAWRSR